MVKSEWPPETMDRIAGADLRKEGIPGKSGGPSTDGVASVAVLPVLQVLCRQDCGLPHPAELAPEVFPELLSALHTCDSEHPVSGTPQTATRCLYSAALYVLNTEWSATEHGPRIMRMCVKCLAQTLKGKLGAHCCVCLSFLGEKGVLFFHMS